MSCTAIGHECYNCHCTGHFTALCRRPHPNGHPAGSFNRSQRDNRGRFHRSSSHQCSSRSPSGGSQSHRSLSCSSCQSISSSHSPSLDHSQRSQRRSPSHGRSSTQKRHQVSHFKSSTPSQTGKGQLYTDRALDGCRAFHTTLQLVTKQGCKPLPIKVNHGADVNTIPLSKYRSLFTPSLKPHTLRGT